MLTRPTHVISIYADDPWMMARLRATVQLTPPPIVSIHLIYSHLSLVYAVVVVVLASF